MAHPRPSATQSDPEGATQRAPEGMQRASLLVRCWVEDTGEGGRVLRGWVRNLDTGREQAFGDVSVVESILARELLAPEAR